MSTNVSRRSLLAGTAAATALTALPLRAARADQPAAVADRRRADDRRRLVSGPSMQIEPGFTYYQDRSVNSIADEFAVNGYHTVHYYVDNELSVDDALIDAFRRRGIGVWAMVVGNGSYSVEGWPDGWQDWQMVLIDNTIDWGGFHLFSPFSPDYVQWKKHLASTLVAEHAFDGYEIAEPYFPDWNGLTSGVYGDIGPLAEQAFQARFGLEIPNFTDPTSALYYKNDPDRYAKWVQLRVDAVNHYVNAIMNGPGGVRRTRRDVLVATWSLGVLGGPDSVALEREYQGLDAGAMTALVRPDLHVIQTNWPDWLQPDLPPDYVTSYRPFVEQIRQHNKSVPIGVQTDIGSQLAMARDDAWIREFWRAARQTGMSTWTAYEYNIGGYMYHDRPVPRSAHAIGKEKIEISFQKRIDPASAAQLGSFTILSAGQETPVPPRSVSTDGNRVVLDLGHRMPEGLLRVAVRNVTDTPSYWLFNQDGPANVVPANTIVLVSRHRH